MQITLRKSMKSLEKLFHTIEIFCDKQNCGSRCVRQLHLAAEEIFTNMLKYNASEISPIIFFIDQKSDEITMIFTDYNTLEFDPRCFIHYDNTLPLKKRPVGKLGLFLVYRFMDEVRYEFQNGVSKITINKKCRSRVNA